MSLGRKRDLIYIRTIITMIVVAGVLPEIIHPWSLTGTGVLVLSGVAVMGTIGKSVLRRPAVDLSEHAFRKWMRLLVGVVTGVLMLSLVIIVQGLRGAQPSDVSRLVSMSFWIGISLLLLGLWPEQKADVKADVKDGVKPQTQTMGCKIDTRCHALAQGGRAGTAGAMLS
jgi:hypothetical protein